MTRARFSPSAMPRPGETPRIRSGIEAVNRDVLAVATRPAAPSRARLTNFRRAIAG
ncbi:MAG: hypothetical protein R6U99_03940 [Nioella sp.]|uniref:hypothetical protein n=1 Tax=Nioella halotolerans TaxID=2303578 RepID=UPI0026BCE41B